MWIDNDARAFAPELRLSPGNEPDRLSWNAAWLAISEAIRPFPDAAKALAALVDRLIAECESYGDPGALKEPTLVGP